MIRQSFDEQDQQYLQNSYRCQAAGDIQVFDDKADKKSAERSTAQEDQGIKAHNAAEQIRRSGRLDGCVAVDHEKNGYGSEERKYNNCNREGGNKAKGGEQDAAEDRHEENQLLRCIFMGSTGQDAGQHGAQAGSKENGTEAGNAVLQDTVCKDRPVSPHVQDQSTYKTCGKEIFEDDRIPAGFPQPSPDFLQRMPFFLLLGNYGIHIDGPVGQKDRDKGKRIEKEEAAVGKIGQEECCQRGSDHAGQVEIGRVETDGAVECLRTDQLRHEGKAGRHIKGIDGPHQEGKEQDPRVSGESCPEEKSQKCGLDHIAELGGHKDFPLVVAVNPETGADGEKKARRELENSQKSQKER